MTKKWYVLQVTTGKEITVKNALERKGYEILVPLIEKQVRKKGAWHTSLEVMFGGYVFIRLQYRWADYYRICKIPNVIKILGGGQNPVPLTSEEIKTIHTIDKLCSISVVTFDDKGNLIPLNGILAMFKDRLIHFKRRQKRAVIEVEIAKTKTRITVPFTETV